MRDDLVTIKSFSSEIQAEVIANKLRAYGIEPFISKDDCGGVDPMMHIASGVHLMVQQKDTQNAISLIEESEYIGKNSGKLSTKSNLPFLILLFLAIGTGLFLSGHTYNPFLIKFGITSLIIGVALWLYMRLMSRKIKRT